MLYGAGGYMAARLDESYSYADTGVCRCSRVRAFAMRSLDL